MARAQMSPKVFDYQIYIQVINAVNRIQTKGDIQHNSARTGNWAQRAVLASEIPRKAVLIVSMCIRN